MLSSKVVHFSSVTLARQPDRAAPNDSRKGHVILGGICSTTVEEARINGRPEVCTPCEHVRTVRRKNPPG